MPAEIYSTILAVSDSSGSRYLVPVNARKTLPPGAAMMNATSGGARRGVSKQSLVSKQTPDSPLNHVGLWVGVANINAVSEPHSGTVDIVTAGTNIMAVRSGVIAANTPTKSAFPLRLIIHVDEAGNASLLKEVIQMFRNGTTKVENGVTVVDVPGTQVLITDHQRIPEFTGVALRDGEVVGRRISAIGFDFPKSISHLPMPGSVSLGGAVTSTITLTPALATLPFLHRRHPDHDNLDAKFEDTLTKPEVPTISRAISLSFDTAAPPDSNSEGFGYSLLTGVYQETLSGLHASALKVSGAFQLTRISPVGELNPSSTPSN